MNRNFLFSVVAILALSILASSFFRHRARREVAANGKPPVEAKIDWTEVEVASGALAFQLRRQPTCEFGDIDAIEVDLHYDPSAPLLLSLEALDPLITDPVEAVPITLTALHDGIEHKFKMPSGHGPYAVLVCRDGSGTKRCRGKDALSPASVVVADSLAVPQESFRPRDRVYFYSLLFPASEAKLAFPREVPLDEATKSWARQLQERSGLPNLPEAIFTAAAHLYFQLHPVPPQWRQGRLELELTQRERKLCH